MRHERCISSKLMLPALYDFWYQAFEAERASGHHAWAHAFSFLNLFQYITFRAGCAFITALIFGFIFGRPLIDLLRRKQGKGQPIREDGPQSHFSKAGTPTMGGLLILSALVVLPALYYLLRLTPPRPRESSPRLIPALAKARRRFGSPPRLANIAAPCQRGGWTSPAPTPLRSMSTPPPASSSGRSRSTRVGAITGRGGLQGPLHACRNLRVEGSGCFRCLATSHGGGDGVIQRDIRNTSVET
jgi:hypothetical protein